MEYWNYKSKCLLKSELVRKGISNKELALRLNKQGIQETKSSIDSKISRGTFSASFLLQSLVVIGCNEINLTTLIDTPLNIAAEPKISYENE